VTQWRWDAVGVAPGAARRALTRLRRAEGPRGGAQGRRHAHAQERRCIPAVRGRRRGVGVAAWGEQRGGSDASV